MTPRLFRTLLSLEWKGLRRSPILIMAFSMYWLLVMVPVLLFSGKDPTLLATGLLIPLFFLGFILASQLAGGSIGQGIGSSESSLEFMLTRSVFRHDVFVVKVACGNIVILLALLPWLVALLIPSSATFSRYLLFVTHMIVLLVTFQVGFHIASFTRKGVSTDPDSQLTFSPLVKGVTILSFLWMVGLPMAALGLIWKRAAAQEFSLEFALWCVLGLIIFYGVLLVLTYRAYIEQEV